MIDFEESQEEINWDDVPEDGPPPLRNYVYEGSVAKTEWRKTKDGRPMLSLGINVTGEYGGASFSRPRKVFDQIVISPESFRAKQCAASAEVPLFTRITVAQLEEFGNALLNARVIFRSKQETYKGRTSAKVDRYLTEAQAPEAAAALEAA
jgi:hypothetical protein